MFAWRVWTTIGCLFWLATPSMSQINTCDKDDDSRSSGTDQEINCVEQGSGSESSSNAGATTNANALCGAQITAKDILGDYTLHVGGAIMTGGGTTIPLNVQSTSDISIFEHGEELMMGDGANNVSLRFADLDDWEMGAEAAMTDVSSPEFAAARGCSASELPHIIGEGKTDILEFVYYLIVESVTANKFQLFGLLEWNGGGINQKRGVVLSPK